MTKEVLPYLQRISSSSLLLQCETHVIGRVRRRRGTGRHTLEGLHGFICSTLRLQNRTQS